MWLYGPYQPGSISTGSVPDWYMGFLDGALRIMPAWELPVAGHPLALGVLVPGLLVPGAFFTLLAAYPLPPARHPGSWTERSAAAAAQDRAGSMIEIRALQALALTSGGEETAGMGVLATALSLACPQGYVRDPRPPARPDPLTRFTGTQATSSQSNPNKAAEPSPARNARVTSRTTSGQTSRVGAVGRAAHWCPAGRLLGRRGQRPTG